MQCTYAQELFSDYLSDEIDRALKVSLENHLTGCAECNQSVAQMRLFWNALDAMPREEPPMFFHENLMSRIAQEESNAEAVVARKRALWDWKSLFRTPTLAYGAAALAFLLIGVEAVQTQRAALGPIAWVAQMGRSAPNVKLELATNQATWTPNATGNGTLTVELKANQPDANRDSVLHYELRYAGATLPLASGEIPAVGGVTLNLTMANAPAADALQVVLSRSGEGAAEQAPQTFPVTMK